MHIASIIIEKKRKKKLVALFPGFIVFSLDGNKATMYDRKDICILAIIVSGNPESFHTARVEVIWMVIGV